MTIYNIVYSSPDHKTYLWNGRDFDLLPDADDSKLFYSGKAYTEDEVIEAVIQSRETASQIFTDDPEPKIDRKEIPVNDSNTEGGHSHHMST